MPLIRIDTIAGRTPVEIKELGNAVHRAVRAALGVPEADRYQIITEHEKSHLIAEDTGLGIPRTERFVLIQIATRRRTHSEKEKLYEFLCRELQEACGVPPSDVMVSIVQNTDEDWSFGNGRAQFLTGELKA